MQQVSSTLMELQQLSATSIHLMRLAAELGVLLYESHRYTGDIRYYAELKSRVFSEKERYYSHSEWSMPSNGISYNESMRVKLAEPTELNISDSYYLTWKAAENADYYDLRIGVMDDSGRLYNET